MDSEEDHRQYDVYRKKAKKLLQRLGADEGTQVVQDEPLYFLCAVAVLPPHAASRTSYLIDHDVCLLTLCDKAYPKKLAYKYLEELRDEFLARHGTELQERRLRPFACQKFGARQRGEQRGAEALDTFIQKTKRLYQDTKSQRNLNKVSSDLKDISRILQRNIDDILERGTKIERASLGTLARSLVQE